MPLTCCSATVKLAGVVFVQREVLAIERPVRQDLDHLPHLLHRLRHVPQVRLAECEIVARRGVGGIPGDQDAVFLDAGLVVAREVVEQPARAEPFPFRHAIEVPHRLLDVIFGILRLVDISGRNREPRIRQPEIRIPRDGVREALPRVLELALRQRLHCRGVLAHDFERGCRKRFHREALRRPGGVVAEGFAHSRRQPGDDAEDVLRGCRFSRSRSRSPGRSQPASP